ncbi:aspartate kinase [Pseudarcicella hirudinis]|uniref:Aspartokinase n=1 Tax=Pseudarcicella hirudinis TaxID=1079859 RepID=A0A1I5VT60_9BACT|nr:aspartate kinase [Pseudarcicella hirudinis]SFQ10156.1 aspartate kinase [Pseudarcicella hirudinis]
MQVWKFGGTSVGKPDRMHSIRNLITENGTRKIVVLSALSGTTNGLLSIAESLKANNDVEGNQKIDDLYAHYEVFIKDLYKTKDGYEQGKAIIDKEFSFIRSLVSIKPFTLKQEKEIVAEGELLSTQMFEAYLKEEGINSALLPALDFMLIDADNEPVLSFTEEKLSTMLEQLSDKQIFITQGFICRNPRGEIDNLKRGGSDYTASLIGGAIVAEEVQIWTDIDGMHNNDPRIVKKTFPIRELTFEEAAELAYFGAKILHPSTITPAKLKGVPVRLKNTMEPEAYGTLIADKTSDREIKAIAAKDNLTAIYIHSTRMLNAYGFLRRVFEVFEKYKTPVDMITTSEVSVSVTIDNDEHLDEIMAELRQFADLEECDKDQTIVCIVGNFSADKEGIALKVLDAMKNIPIRMICYGASEHNISLLIHGKNKAAALNALNERCFLYEDAMKDIFSAQ